MKKIDYQAPEMQVIKLAMENTVLVTISSGGGSTPGMGGSADDDDEF